MKQLRFTTLAIIVITIISFLFFIETCSDSPVEISAVHTLPDIEITAIDQP